MDSSFGGARLHTHCLLPKKTKRKWRKPLKYRKKGILSFKNPVTCRHPKMVGISRQSNVWCYYPTIKRAILFQRKMPHVKYKFIAPNAKQVTGRTIITTGAECSSKLAENDSNDEEHQDGYNGNGNDTIRSHSEGKTWLVFSSSRKSKRHPSVRLPINWGSGCRGR